MRIPKPQKHPTTITMCLSGFALDMVMTMHMLTVVVAVTVTNRDYRYDYGHGSDKLTVMVLHTPKVDRIRVI